jgi:hypothetical protein
MGHISVGLASQVLDTQSKSTFLLAARFDTQRLSCPPFSASLKLHAFLSSFGVVELFRGGAEVRQEMDCRVMSDSTTAGFAPRSKVELSKWDRLIVFALVENFDGRFALRQGSSSFA